MKYSYLGPFIHGVAEYRIGGEVGYVNKKNEKVHNVTCSDKRNNFDKPRASRYSHSRELQLI